jgi:hypothetical protein
VIAILVEDLAEAPSGSALVLDDYHEIQNQDVHEAVKYLVDNLPDGLDLWQAFDTTPAFPRLISWMISEGMDVTFAMSGHQLILKVADTARARGSKDPLTAAGVMALLGLAGAGYGPAVNRALGRDPDDPTLYDTTALMFGAWIERQDGQTS